MKKSDFSFVLAYYCVVGILRLLLYYRFILFGIFFMLVDAPLSAFIYMFGLSNGVLFRVLVYL